MRSLPFLLAWAFIFAPLHAADWQDQSNRAVLRNESLEASFQSGLLYQLKDLSTGEVLLSVEPGKLPSKLSLFGKRQIDLAGCTCSASAMPTKLTSQFKSSDGSEWVLNWRIEPAGGDLIFSSSAKSAEPVDDMRGLLFGCDISRHKLVSV